MIKKKVRTFSATDSEIEMLEALAEYHNLNKSAALTALVKKEFWRVFPRGKGKIKPDRDARLAPLK